MQIFIHVTFASVQALTSSQRNKWCNDVPVISHQVASLIKSAQTLASNNGLAFDDTIYPSNSIVVVLNDDALFNNGA